MSLPQEIRRMWESLEGRGILGQRVERVATALPGAAARFNLFLITGGEVLLTTLYGVCTVGETGGAITMLCDATPTVGTGPSLMSTASAINGCAIGDMVVPQGNIANPAIPAAGISGCGATMWMPFLCKVGSIGNTLSAVTADSSWRWVLCYIPLTEGALIQPTYV